MKWVTHMHTNTYEYVEYEGWILLSHCSIQLCCIVWKSGNCFFYCVNVRLAYCRIQTSPSRCHFTQRKWWYVILREWWIRSSFTFEPQQDGLDWIGVVKPKSSLVGVIPKRRRINIESITWSIWSNLNGFRKRITCNNVCPKGEVELI